MDNLTKGTRRIADALDFISQVRTAPSSRQIFERLNAPRSSGYDLLSGLSDRSFLQQRAGGRWILGNEVHALAMSRFGLGHIASMIVAVLSALREETQECAQLNVLNNKQVLVTHVFSSLRSMSLSSDIGAEIPVNCIAAGRLLVADLNEKALRRLLKTQAHALSTGYASADCEQMLRDVLEAKRRGHAVELHRPNQDAASIAAPVIDSHGKCRAAVTLILPAARLANCQDTLITSVRTAATSLTRGLSRESRTSV